MVESEVTPEMQMAIDIAVIKATQATHERRITSVENTQRQALITGLISSLSSIGALVILVLTFLLGKH